MSKWLLLHWYICFYISILFLNFNSGCHHPSLTYKTTALKNWYTKKTTEPREKYGRREKIEPSLSNPVLFVMQGPVTSKLKSGISANLARIDHIEEAVRWVLAYINLTCTQQPYKHWALPSCIAHYFLEKKRVALYVWMKWTS